MKSPVTADAARAASASLSALIDVFEPETHGREVRGVYLDAIGRGMCQQFPIDG
jgi:hypothetical protein